MVRKKQHQKDIYEELETNISALLTHDDQGCRREEGVEAFRDGESDVEE